MKAAANDDSRIARAQMRDPALFAPAAITLVSDRTGATFTYGSVNNKIIHESVRS